MAGMADSPLESGARGAATTATRLLARLSDGDSAAASDLLPLVYDELRRIAETYFRSQPGNHTLQPTAIVHEAYLKLIRGTGEWRDREHFSAVAATAMRQILIDHARAKRTAKRDPERAQVTFDSLATPSGSTIDLVALDDALTRLTAMDERLGRIVELRFFGGYTMEEVAEHLHVTRRTAQSDWRWIRAWLSRELAGDVA